jgi:hypothetical protein
MVMAKSNRVRVELASSATSLSTHKPAKKNSFSCESLQHQKAYYYEEQLQQ